MGKNDGLVSLAYKPDKGMNLEQSQSRRTANESAYVYDPQTKKWVPPASSNPYANPWRELTLTNTIPTTTNTSTPTPTPASTTPTQVDSKTQAEKEYIEIELNTLVGEVNVVPSKKSIKLKVNNTVTISGVGSYLSGDYFISAIKRSISRDSGYSQSMTVIKNGFGDKLKQPKVESSSTTPETNRQDPVEKSAPAFKVGDTVKIVGDAIYSNAHEGVKVPEWVKKQTLTIKQISSDGARALLMPITSWTYIKFLQKA